jgi:cell division ATPase FtsA
VGSSELGGIHITKDISTILNINFEAAEKIKNLNSSLMITPLEEKEVIKLIKYFECLIAFSFCQILFLKSKVAPK